MCPRPLEGTGGPPHRLNNSLWPQPTEAGWAPDVGKHQSLSKTCSDPAGQLCLHLELGVIQSHLHKGWSQPCPNPVAGEQRQGWGWGRGSSHGAGVGVGGRQREEASHPEKGKGRKGQLPGDSLVPTGPLRVLLQDPSWDPSELWASSSIYPLCPRSFERVSLSCNSGPVTRTAAISKAVFCAPGFSTKSTRTGSCWVVTWDLRASGSSYPTGSGRFPFAPLSSTRVCLAPLPS